MTESNHPQVNYKLTFVLLIVALVVSLILGVYVGGQGAITAIFVIAAYKAYLVLTRFMHLSFEPTFVKIGMGVMLVLLGLLFVGFYPDIVLIFGGKAVH